MKKRIKFLTPDDASKWYGIAAHNDSNRINVVLCCDDMGIHHNGCFPMRLSILIACGNSFTPQFIVRLKLLHNFTPLDWC
mgnify:CR=1 FL=1